VTAEVEHDATPKGGQIFIVNIAAVVVAHRGLDLVNFSQPFFADDPFAELNRRIAAKHIADLEREIPLLATPAEFPEKVHILAAGLVHVHRQIPLHAAEGGRDQIRIGRFDHYRLKAGNAEKLLFRHKRQAFIRFEEVGGNKPRAAGGRAIIDDADDFEDIRQSSQRRDFPVGVFVANADLSDLDLFHHASGSCGFTAI